MEIEESFGILPLELISKKAQANIRELLTREHTVRDCAEAVDSFEDDKVPQAEENEDRMWGSRDRVEVDPATGKSETIVVDKICAGNDD